MGNTIKVTVNANGEIFKTFKAKSDDATVFVLPMAKDDYWKLQYDVNRATHVVEKKNKTFSITVKTYDGTVDAAGEAVIVKTDEYTTRADFYAAVKKLLVGAKGKKKVAAKKTAAKKAKVPTIDITGKTRKELIDMAKALGITGYSDLNMKQIAEKIALKKAA